MLDAQKYPQDFFMLFTNAVYFWFISLLHVYCLKNNARIYLLQ